MEDPDPEPTVFIWFIVTFLFVVVCFLASLGESAVLSANEKKVRENAEDGDKKAIRLVKLLDRRTRLSNIATLGTLLSALMIGTSTIVCFDRPFAVWIYKIINSRTEPAAFMSVFLSYFLLTLAVVFGITVFGVLWPRKLGAQNSDKIAPKMAGYMLFLRNILLPLYTVLSGIAKFFVKVFGGDPHYEEEAVTEDEILSMVDVGEEKGVIEESQKEMINNIFEFDDLVASDVMTHRTSVEAVEMSDSLAEVVEKAIAEGYSRMPVYDEDLDNIKGILYVKDLLKYVGSTIPAELKPSDIMREALFIPESKNCRELFSEMSEKHLQMVIVSDEYGGVAGVVTMEDLLESIVGNMQDEFDDESEEIEQVSEHIYNIDGMSLIGEVEDLLGIEFPEGEYDTLAGYIMSVIGKIPEPDEHPVIEFEGYSFTVAEMEERRILKVTVERLPEPIDLDENFDE